MEVSSSADPRVRIFLREDGVMTAPPTLSGAGGSAVDINNRNQIIGQVYGGSSDPPLSGVMWYRGDLTSLTPTGHEWSGAGAINNALQAIGSLAGREQGTTLVMWKLAPVQ